jgi:membrane fusion protein, multidrug efflux system
VNPESADDPGDPARAGHGAEATSAPARRSKPRRVRVWLSLVAACFVAVAVIGLISRQLQFKKLQETTGVLDEQFVETVQPEKVPATVTLNLPGQTEAYTQAPIYAQVNGYLRSWYSDIGAKVKMGDVLAEIDTPALDQQLAQARANLKQSQATLWVSQANYNRQIDLLNKKVISQEDFDNQSGDLQAKQATVNAQEANVRQLEAMEAFKVLRAPFDGTVTVRDTDIGALINAGSGNPLFIVSQVSALRAYVNVPESLAASVKAGTKANLTFDTFPGVEFPAQVVATSGAIDPTTRTLQTQLTVPNADGKLFPGSYTTVHFELESDSRSLLVPENVLLFREEGPAVGTVGSDGKVSIRKIKIDRDLGNTLQVQGLSESDQIIVNPSDSLADGDLVRVKPREIHIQAQRKNSAGTCHRGTARYWCGTCFLESVGAGCLTFRRRAFANRAGPKGTALATLGSFGVGLGVISLLMKFVSRRSFLPFAIYRLLLGAKLLVPLSKGILRSIELPGEPHIRVEG